MFNQQEQTKEQQLEQQVAALKIEIYDANKALQSVNETVQQIGSMVKEFTGTDEETLQGIMDSLLAGSFVAPEAAEDASELLETE
ncbi:hypothetical protein G3R49_19320 [Shewanella sp. WXL01]|uniref:hypothetical protein n=1 Tax=Shewanella sp. WXL01 TaxID=2709721 RepID=UPI00143856C6|nr:hypothetical protein [Shewanella sp. WXL01]NKF52710.1 hypothetical protein [Shewanella sp. WXL01]